MDEFISLQSVCSSLGVTEARLRHTLRRADAPRPASHPTARVFLWTRADLERLRSFLAERERGAEQAQGSVDGGAA